MLLPGEVCKIMMVKFFFFLYFRLLQKYHLIACAIEDVNIRKNPDLKGEEEQWNNRKLTNELITNLTSLKRISMSTGLTKSFETHLRFKINQ